MTQEEVVARVLDALAQACLPHMVSGSFASNLHGVPRMTQDADVVVDSDETGIIRLVHLLEQDFYVSEDAARDAVRSRRMFKGTPRGTVPGLITKASPTPPRCRSGGQDRPCERARTRPAPARRRRFP